MVAVEISSEYAWVLLTASIIAVQVIFQGFAIGGQRRKHFNKEFFKKNFKDIKESDIPQGGYPDMGNGKYADKLSLDAWRQFNNYQRAHYNYVEGVASILTLVLVVGVFEPAIATFSGLFYVVGRAFYALGYRANGPKGRLIGALMIDVALVALLFYAVTSAFSFGGGISGFTTLFENGLHKTGLYHYYVKLF